MKAPLKILLIASESAEGMVPFASSIINSLSSDKRFDVRAIVINSPSGTYSGKILFGNTIYLSSASQRWKRLLYKFYNHKLIKTIKTVEKQFSPDCIHFLTIEFSLTLHILLHKRNNKYCYTVHDLHPHETSTKRIPDILLAKYVTWCTKANCRLISNLNTCSISQYDELKLLYGNKHVSFVPFPTLITPPIANGNKEVKELAEIDNYILFFGRVDAYKGIDILIQAYLESSKLQRFKLVIAGRGQDSLNKTFQNKNIIRINRFIDDEEINYLFHKSSVVVYPYISATMSGVLSLSFYYNKKTVLSDVQFFKEYENNCTFFFRAGDKGDLGNSLLQALESPIIPNHEIYKRFYDHIRFNDSLLQFYKNRGNCPAINQ